MIEDIEKIILELIEKVGKENFISVAIGCPSIDIVQIIVTYNNNGNKIEITREIQL